jgi:8-oxo-dGTP pyrophosphatase MutT (NUDIX family)
MVVRDRPGLEVLVLQRTANAVFSPSATVFPGGAVDDDDNTLVDRVLGMDDVAAGVEHGLEGGALRYRIAAVRECFEEAGILLARERASNALATPKPAWRDACNAGHATFRHVLEAEDLVIDARDLLLFGHWLTPLGAPRRYDTWFFVARAPDGQVAAHDDNEAVASAWVRPADALAAYARAEIELILPTLRSVQMLARFPTTGALFSALGEPMRGVIAEGSGERIALLDDAPARAAWTNPLPDISWRDEQRFTEQTGS